MEILDPLPTQQSTSEPLRPLIRPPPSMLDRLRVAPECFHAYLQMSSIASTDHVLAELKSLFPRTALEPLADGYALGTTSKRVDELLKEVEPVAVMLANDVVPEDGDEAPANH